MKDVLINPPNGWLYGYPKRVKENITKAEIKEMLIRSKYPRGQIDSALEKIEYSEIK